jgi:NTP pyrophosphatase (non-canonical NTP hydrolase)
LETLIVNAIQCGNCKDIVFSRANHDWRACSCHKNEVNNLGCYIDGGFERVFGTGGYRYTHLSLRLKNITKAVLYKDWSTKEDKYGLYKGGKLPECASQIELHVDLGMSEDMTTLQMSSLTAVDRAKLRASMESSRKYESPLQTIVTHDYSILKTLQSDDYKKWVVHNFGNHPSWKPLLGMVEELGELAHAYLKRSEGIKLHENHDEKIKDAVADIVIFMADFCNLEGIPLEETVQKIWDEVKQRDFKKFPKNGISE